MSLPEEEEEESEQAEDEDKRWWGLLTKTGDGERESALSGEDASLWSPPSISLARSCSQASTSRTKQITVRLHWVYLPHFPLFSNISYWNWTPVHVTWSRHEPEVEDNILWFPSLAYCLAPHFWIVQSLYVRTSCLTLMSLPRVLQHRENKIWLLRETL